MTAKPLSPVRVNPLSLIRQPNEPVTITRRPDSDLVFTARLGIPILTLYAGTQPDAIDYGREIPFTLEDRAAVVDHAAAGLDPTHRYYFTIRLIDGSRLLAAERYLPLTGAFNARDLGGYTGHDGKTVKWGQVFRSGHLHGLTPADQAYLEHVGIRLVCDLRVPDETAAKPDQPIPGAASFARPLITEGSKIKQVITLLLYRKRLDQLLLRGYIGNMIDQNAAVFGAMYRQLADPAHRPALLHCTAGKDRAGMSAALLLGLLGVDADTIAADYSLSNQFYDQFRDAAGAQADKLRKLGIAVDALHPMLLADPNTMYAALAYIDTRHGGIEAYLTRQAGLTTAEIDRLRTDLLV